MSPCLVAVVYTGKRRLETETNDVPLRLRRGLDFLRTIG